MTLFLQLCCLGKCTTIGVVTDINGKYSINAPNRDIVLVFLFMCYASKEFVGGDQRAIEVVLNESMLQIDEAR